MDPNRPRRSQKLVVWGLVWAASALILAAMSCGAVPTPQVITTEGKAILASADIGAPQIAGYPHPGVVATPIPAPAEIPAEAARTAGGPPATAGRTVSGIERKIIKDAQLDLLVQDTDTAIDRITGVAVEFDGFILDSRTWFQGDYKYATLVLHVPVQFFEQALQRLRAIALKVGNETVSGQDVTEQYVDLQSRLRNLEATEARIRSFLDRADNVEEALQVNQELSKIEEQIEGIKGKLTFLTERSAMSAITVDLRPDVPTPTVTPPVTVTPTPTATPVAAWSPGDTYRQASGFLSLVILRRLGDAAIWTSVVCGPFLIPLILIALALRTFGPRLLQLGRARSRTSEGEAET